MAIVVVDTETIQVLIEEIQDLKKSVQKLQQPTKTEKKAPGIDWIRLDKALDEYHLNVSKDKWEDDLKHEIKYRQHGRIIWVHVPSINKWLMDMSIN